MDKFSANLPSTSAPSLSFSETNLSDEQDLLSCGSDDDTDSAPKKNIRRTTKLSQHLKGLMGEANLRFARGEFEIAKKMCFEVIRQAPEAYEPYLTLAQMHENTNLKKYKGFLILAGHLQPSNSEIWCRLAECELMENQVKEAIRCYAMALKANPSNIEIHKKRLLLVSQTAPDSRMALNCKLQIAKFLPTSKDDQIVNICNEVAKEFFQAKNYIKAIEALKIPIKRIPNKITQDVLNMMLELLLLSERYSECLDIFTQFCGFSFDITLGENMAIIINSYTMPEDIHIDLKTKFIVCLVRLHSYALVAPLIDEMIEKDDVEIHGMLFFDIVEALMAISYYHEALQLTVPLTKSKNYSLAAVWLKHGECLSHLGMYDQAIEAYFTVISMAPNHVEVLYPLAMLLLKQDKKKEALSVMSQDLSTGKLHVGVLLEQMKLLKQIEDLDNYWKCVELLLSRHCIRLKCYEELKIVTTHSRVHEKMSKIAKFRMFKGEDPDMDFNLESIFEPTIEEEYQLFRDILQFAYEKKEYYQLQKFVFMGLSSKRFSKFFAELHMIACYACFFTKDFFHGYSIARELLVRHSRTNVAWYLYSLLADMNEDARSCYRFLDARGVAKVIPIKPKELVLGNHACSVGHYPEALSYFLSDYRETKNTYAAFMIAVCMLQHYCQRYQKMGKPMLETITYLFISYAKNRSKKAKQEAYYNLARMYQQLGIFHLAERYYKKVLEVKNELLNKYPEILGLKEEAAYNLHLIYKNSGNFVAAKRVLFENIVI